jgi:hypothetical protein
MLTWHHAFVPADDITMKHIFNLNFTLAHKFNLNEPPPFDELSLVSSNETASIEKTLHGDAVV